MVTYTILNSIVLEQESHQEKENLTGNITKYQKAKYNFKCIRFGIPERTSYRNEIMKANDFIFFFLHSF